MRDNNEGCANCGCAYGEHHAENIACPVHKDRHGSSGWSSTNYFQRQTTHVSGLPADAKKRKNIPVYTGFIKYFPRAVCAVAELSREANEQHNPGTPVHWDKSKSKDELDALMRHLIDDALGVPHDSDGVLHATKMAWRAMANLERVLEPV